MIDDSVIKKAIEFSNKLEKQIIECPRECLNPGLYFGYIAGAEAMQNEIYELRERLGNQCPFYCYFEGKHPGCDRDDCDYIGYLFKDVK